MALSGEQFTITAGEHEATIAAVGSSLRRYTRGGIDVTVPFADDVLAPRCCGCTLVPWPNRLRNGSYRFEGVAYRLPVTEPELGNATHGLGRWARWSAVEHLADRVTTRFDIVAQPGYPFEVSVEVSYTLDSSSGLSVSARARNHGRGNAPFGAGFHPYLSTHGAPLDDVEVQVPAASRLLLDAAQVPVGSQPVQATPYDLRSGAVLGAMRLDDGFTGLGHDAGRGVAHVRASSGGAALWFDEAFRFLQVYTLDDLAGAGPGVAVEPMTCAADAFNSGAGLNVLAPGGTWSGSWGISPLVAAS